MDSKRHRVYALTFPQRLRWLVISAKYRASLSKLDWKQTAEGQYMNGRGFRVGSLIPFPLYHAQSVLLTCSSHCLLSSPQVFNQSHVMFIHHVVLFCAMPLPLGATPSYNYLDRIC